MAKRILIAVGTAHYDNLPADLQRPQLKQVVDSVAALFTNKLGYERALEEISTDPTSTQLSSRLDQWAASSQRDGSDWIVFYYTGHSELIGDSLFLLTKDSEVSVLQSTAVNVETLTDILIARNASGENRKVKRCLFILDTSYSGAGALGLHNRISKLFPEGVRDGMFYVLAAAFPREESRSGALAQALIQSLEDESLGAARQPLIFFDQLIPAVNRRLGAQTATSLSHTNSHHRPQISGSAERAR
jgi:hypothetical protein